MALTLTDDLTMSVLTAGFGRSGPGDALHHLVLLRETRNGLGLPQPAISVYVIDAAVDGPAAAERFTATAIRDAVRNSPGVILLAALSVEIFAVALLDDEAAENQARVLSGNGHLEQHPDAAECTQLYAAAGDGTRWTGRHWLTGPRAGEITGPTRWERDSRGDHDQWPFATLVRKAVGLGLVTQGRT